MKAVLKIVSIVLGFVQEYRRQRKNERIQKREKDLHDKSAIDSYRHHFGMHDKSDSK